MKLLFWFYVFACAVLLAGGSFYFYSQRQEITAGIFFAGILSAIIFFGLRWFPASGPAKPTWKPVLNYCPDFLTLYDVDGEKVCVDTVGVAQSGGISTWSDPTQTDEKYLFHLFLNTTGPTRIKNLCDEANTKKVTWEGVWNGSTCMGVEPPRPPMQAEAPRASA